MTSFRQKVTRRTESPYNHQGRRVVVTLAPGDVVVFREERRKVTFTASVNWLFQKTMELQARKTRLDRVNKRRAVARGILKG